MQTTLFPVISRPTVDFVEALAAASGALQPPYHASAIYSLYGLPSAGNRRFLIRSIEWTAVESIGLEFDFFATSTGGLLGSFAFIKANGAQYNSAGVYRYAIDGLAIPYYNTTAGYSQIAPPAMYVGVQNCDVTAKSADAAGQLTVTIWAEPQESVQG